MRRFQLPVGVYLALVFLSGVLIGAFGLRLYMVKSVSAGRNHTTAEEYRRRYLDDMREHIGLSQTQVTQINSILDQTRTRFHEIHKAIDPALEQLKEQQRNKVRALLTPEQRPKYQKWLDDREKSGR